MGNVSGGGSEKLALLQKIDNLVNNIGVLAQLATTNKTSLVAAINELNENLANKANSNHTHNYAGSSSVGGSANSAVKLDSSAGSTTQPVYFNGGKPVACKHTLGKSVPSNAVFTDRYPYIITVDKSVNRAFNAFESTMDYIAYTSTPTGYKERLLGGYSSGDVLLCTATGWVLNPRNSTSYVVSKITWMWLMEPV